MPFLKILASVTGLTGTGVQFIFQSLLGLLAGWGIGSAAMKAALAVRSQVVAESTLERAVNTSVVSRVLSNKVSNLTPNTVFKAL